MRSPAVVTRRARRPRRGATLVEMMVAIGIISIGLLALSGSAMMVTRLMGGGARQAQVANAAQARLETLRASPCAALTAGTDTVRGIIRSWTATPVTRGVDVKLTVQYAMVGAIRGLHTQTYKTILPC